MEKPQEVSQETAAAAMRAAGLRAAMPWDTPEAIAARGQAFLLPTDTGPLVFVTHGAAGVLYIDAAAAPQGGQGMTAQGLQLAEEVARGGGFGEVAFQTVRRGLVRQAEKHGYVVAGYIMKKAIQ